MTAPATRFFLLTTAPVPAPTTPPMTAPFAVLLHPFFSGASAAAGVAPVPVPAFVLAVSDPSLVEAATVDLVCVGLAEDFLIVFCGLSSSAAFSLFASGSCT